MNIVFPIQIQYKAQTDQSSFVVTGISHQCNVVLYEMNVNGICKIAISVCSAQEQYGYMVDLHRYVHILSFSVCQNLNHTDLD